MIACATLARNHSLMNNIFKIAVAIAFVGLISPTLAKTMSIPSDESPTYTVEIPNDWNPKVSEEAVEATEPDNHVYVSGWVVTKSDIGDLKKDLGDLLKDEMKSIDGEPSEETIENNGIKFSVLRGHGKDKKEGSDVTFLVALFPAGSGKAGVFYADWDTDAPSSTKEKINSIMNSIKVKK